MTDRTPTEATLEMRLAGLKVLHGLGYTAITASDMWPVYRAMLAASPAAPGAEVVPVAFNINETVLVRLNDHGREIIQKDDAKWGELYPRLRGHSTLPEEDADGWSTWQLWHLMKTFGRHMVAGAPNPFDITIRIPLPSPPTTDAIKAQARREALEEAAAYHDEEAECYHKLMLGNIKARNAKKAAKCEERVQWHRAQAGTIRALAGKGEAEGNAVADAQREYDAALANWPSSGVNGDYRLEKAAANLEAAKQAAAGGHGGG